MTAQPTDEAETEESLASQNPGALEPLPTDSPQRNETGSEAPADLDLDPHPADIEPEDHIRRGLTWWDHEHQMTIWDRQRSVPYEHYEAKTTAIERKRPDVDVPEIDEKGCLADYTEYRCISCREMCIEPEGTEFAQKNECRTCHLLPSL